MLQAKDIEDKNIPHKSHEDEDNNDKELQLNKLYNDQTVLK